MAKESSKILKVTNNVGGYTQSATIRVILIEMVQPWCCASVMHSVVHNECIVSCIRAAGGGVFVISIQEDVVLTN